MNSIYQSNVESTPITSTNVDSWIDSKNMSVTNDVRSFGFRLGNRFTVNDGQYNCEWMVVAINIFANNRGISDQLKHIVIMPTFQLPNINPNLDYGMNRTDLLPMNSTKTTGVSQNPLNPLYEITQGQEMAGYQGFYGSDMCQIHLPAIGNQLRSSVFGGHMYYIKVLRTDTVDLTAVNKNGLTGMTTKWSGFETTCIGMPTESTFAGYSCFGSSAYDDAIFPFKFPLYNFISPLRFSREDFWLQNVCDKYSFGRFSKEGHLTTRIANNLDSSNIYNTKLKPFIVIGI